MGGRSDGKATQDVVHEDLHHDDRHEERQVYHPYRRYDPAERGQHRLRHGEHQAPDRVERGARAVGEPTQESSSEQYEDVDLAEVEEGVTGAEVEEHRGDSGPVAALLEAAPLL